MIGRLWLLAMGSMVALFAPCFGAPGYFDLRSDVTLEGGESWSDRGQRFRLYGVQSCIRGTTFINRSGQRRDCGDASMAVFAAFIKDTHPQCAPVVRVGALSYVVCFSTVGTQTIDLATALISEGYAFAALDTNGLPINSSYAVAEQDAKRRKAGLWQFPDVQHPSLLLSHAANIKGENQP
ncbi:thermonuclease family protein [Rhizobium tumorigenes]|uniref:thermonuclease family protein n=1 Tax=Rhizobium tumorigenes TaxID=2041385 RepID=UPI003BF94C76